MPRSGLEQQLLRKEGNVLFNDAQNTFYGYMAREETRCRHIGYSFRLAARVLLYALSHRQDITYHGPFHQSWSNGWNEKYFTGSTTKDRSDDTPHNMRTLLPPGYISLPLVVWRGKQFRFEIAPLTYPCQALSVIYTSIPSQNRAHKRTIAAN